MVRALPEDGRRYETIDGELYVNGVLAPDGDLAALDRARTPTPSWAHGEAVQSLFLRLHAYLAASGAGAARLAPTDVLLGSAVVQPDLFVVPLAAGRRPRTWEEAGTLLLAVEVLSPGTARADQTVKRRLYQREGVPEYWIVDLDARLVERWRRDDERPEIRSARLEWQPTPAQAALVIDLPSFFAEVLGE